MESFPLALSLTPLALYLLVLGAINLKTTASVKTGARDSAALGFAVAGFVIIGPMQLFMPDNAAVRFGTHAWVYLLALYGLCITLYILISRPRLIIYNHTYDQTRQALNEVAAKLDSEPQWVGETLNLPNLGVHLLIDEYAPMRNVTLSSVSSRQSFTGWERLGKELSKSLKAIPVARNPRGFRLLAFGLTMLIFPIWQVAQHPKSMLEQMTDFFLR